jgi:hypothetical protein
MKPMKNKGKAMESNFVYFAFSLRVRFSVQIIAMFQNLTNCFIFVFYLFVQIHPCYPCCPLFPPCPPAHSNIIHGEQQILHMDHNRKLSVLTSPTAADSAKSLATEKELLRLELIVEREKMLKEEQGNMFDQTVCFFALHAIDSQNFKEIDQNVSFLYLFFFLFLFHFPLKKHPPHLPFPQNEYN